MTRYFAAGAALCALGLWAAPVSAQASEKSVRALLTLTGSGKVGVQVVQAMLPDLKRMVPDAPESFWDDFRKSVNADELVGLVVPIYRKHFSEPEVQEILRFYRSPAGKKMIQAQPLILQESMTVGRQWGQQLAQRVLEKAKKLPKKPR